jgi:prepilin-type N-terminal cleavage/methylation domain-containing protein
VPLWLAKIKKGDFTMKKMRRFTLIELLMVVGIIAILASWLLPSLPSATDNAKKMRAEEAIIALQTSLIKYESEHQIYPVDYSAGDIIWSDNNTSEYDTLIEHLSCIDVNQDSNKNFNTREKRYLLYHPPTAAPAPSANGRTLTDAYKSPENEYGKRLGIAFDLDGNDKVIINGKILNGQVFIWSFGKNNKNEWGNGDDVTSW